MKPIPLVSASAATPRAAEFPAPKVGFGGPPAASDRLADIGRYRLRAPPGMRFLQSPSRPLRILLEALWPPARCIVAKFTRCKQSSAAIRGKHRRFDSVDRESLQEAAWLETGIQASGMAKGVPSKASAPRPIRSIARIIAKLDEEAKG